MIELYRWDDAPDILKKLSNHGGDEDWLALVPWRDVPHIGPHGPEYFDDGQSVEPQDFYLPFSSEFGCCSISYHKHPFDLERFVLIGAHA